MKSTLQIWVPYQPTKGSLWNLYRVVHLHRRAGFAAPWKILQRDLADGPEKSVGRLVLPKAADDGGEFDSLSNTIGSAAVNSSNPNRLKAWWLFRMLRTADPLGERLTLMWHNHFATSNRKVKNLAMMHQQNELFREHGRGSFGTLLQKVVKHPAMMIWLDADSNRKGQPNENLSREMLELFTLGAGNYSESDVKESARALTGWAVVSDRFENRSKRHDDGILTILGEEKPFTGDQLLDLLTGHEATAQRIAWRLCKTFMAEGFCEANKEAVNELADVLTANQFDIGVTVATMLRSALFFSDDNIRSKVVGPVEFIVGAVRSLGLNESTPSTLLLSEWVSRMGQDLFYPPNVGGWNEGRSWLSSRSIVARANVADALTNGKLWQSGRAPRIEPTSLGLKDGCSLEATVSRVAEILIGSASGTLVKEVLDSVESSETNQPVESAIKLLISRPENQLG